MKEWAIQIIFITTYSTVGAIKFSFGIWYKTIFFTGSLITQIIVVILYDCYIMIFFLRKNCVGSIYYMHARCFGIGFHQQTRIKKDITIYLIVHQLKFSYFNLQLMQCKSLIIFSFFIFNRVVNSNKIKNLLVISYT